LIIWLLLKYLKCGSDILCGMGAIAFGVAGGCLCGGALAVDYLYGKGITRPASDAKARLFLELLEEKWE